MNNIIVLFFMTHLGRQHHKQIRFCGCEEQAVTLVKMSLWPGSATCPSVAFHFKLMELAETLLLECHVSLKKFCDALGILTKSTMLPKWVSKKKYTANSIAQNYKTSNFKVE
jgi:hypothetical protein